MHMFISSSVVVSSYVYAFWIHMNQLMELAAIEWNCAFGCSMYMWMHFFSFRGVYVCTLWMYMNQLAKLGTTVWMKMYVWWWCRYAHVCVYLRVFMLCTCIYTLYTCICAWMCTCMYAFIICMCTYATHSKNKRCVHIYIPHPNARFHLLLLLPTPWVVHRGCLRLTAPREPWTAPTPNPAHIWLCVYRYTNTYEYVNVYICIGIYIVWGGYD